MLPSADTADAGPAAAAQIVPDAATVTPTVNSESALLLTMASAFSGGRRRLGIRASPRTDRCDRGGEPEMEYPRRPGPESAVTSGELAADPKTDPDVQNGRQDLAGSQQPSGP
jgi:hypothetical protein